MATDSRSAQARRRARQAPRRPAPHPGARHLRGRHQDRRHAAPGVQAQRRRARPHPFGRHQRRGRRWTASRRCSPARRSPSCSRRCRSARRFPSPPHRAVAADVVRYAGEPVAVVVASNRYTARDAADAIVVDIDPLPAVVDPELAMTGTAGGHPRRLPEQPRGRARAERHRRQRRLGTVDDTAVDKAFAAAEVVHLAAHGEPAPGAQRDGAARRRSRTSSRARGR